MKVLFSLLALFGLVEAFNINSNPQLALNGDGNAIACWEAYDGDNVVIQKASRPNAGMWGMPVTVSQVGSNASDPSLSMNAMGEITALWQRMAGTGSFVVTSDITTFGGMDTIASISTETQGPLFPAVAVDGTGNAVALWQRVQGNKYLVMASTYLTSSGQWGTPVAVNATDPSLILPSPRIAITSGGKAVAVWHNGALSDSFIRAAFLDVGGSWTFPAVLSASGESARNPQVAINTSEDVMAIWHESSGSISRVVARACNPSGNWGSPIPLSATNINAKNAQIALNDSGKAVAVWEKSTSSTANRVVQAAVFSGTSWGEPVDLSSTSFDVATPQIALNAAGEAVALWTAENMSGNLVIQTAFLLTGGSWSAVDTLSDTDVNSQFSQVRFDAAGNAIAVWETVSGNESVIQANFRPTGSVWGTAQTISQPIP